MKFIPIKDMNVLVAYGGADGDYYTVDDFKGKADMYVVAKVRKGKIKANSFDKMAQAVEWIED